MGFKPRGYLSVLAFAATAAVLVGCNNTNPRPSYIESKGPPGSPQTTQRPGNQSIGNQAFPQANNGQKPSPFQQTNNNNAPNPFNPAPTPPNPFAQNPGTVISQQPGVPNSPPVPPTFNPMSSNPPGVTPLPGNVVRDTLPADSKIFVPNGNLPVAPPPNMNNFTTPLTR